ncbi:uncharacterized protein C9orf85 homolog [Clytia hemisphaerica]|uniref:uncharacterized protein C9orf85 homolog n=1 Tax=Clytia hemisphaerica TaxID=252671 RepID=UPI0034D5C1A6|eukprot:TCONS_00010246-protein
MSTQRGNTTKKRAQKHKNITKFINDKYDTTGKMKQINQLVVSNVCQRCKDCIEWKIKYKKYKPLTVPAKCKKCDLKKVKYAYHIVCSECAVSLKICAKCSMEKEVVGEVEKSTSEKQREESLLREELKFMRLREKRTLMRQLEKGEKVKVDMNENKDEEDEEDDEDDENESGEEDEIEPEE